LLRKAQDTCNFRSGGFPEKLLSDRNKTGSLSNDWSQKLSPKMCPKVEISPLRSIEEKHQRTVSQIGGKSEKQVQGSFSCILAQKVTELSVAQATEHKLVETSTFSGKNEHVFRETTTIIAYLCSHLVLFG
jgi:hypothetical protein